MKLIMEKCPTDMCHASTLLKIGPDRFLAAWFGGTKEGNGDVAIWFTRGNEEHFEEPKILAQSEEAHWNPVLFRVDEKKIIIFYKVGNEISKWRPCTGFQKITEKLLEKKKNWFREIRAAEDR